MDHTPLPPDRSSLSPLPAAHRSGLAAVTTLASISFVSSTVLFVHLTYKLARWHAKSRRALCRAKRVPPSPGVDLSLGLAERHFGNHDEEDPKNGRTTRRKPEPNQFVVLIYNLLLADMHQAMAFLLNGVWVGKNAVEVHTGTCWTQGFFVSTGDLSASLFITAIAIHTYAVIVRGYKPPQWAIIATCVGIWIFNYGMVIIGIASTSNGNAVGGFYVRAAAWCWINEAYENYRLLTHYLFIFLSLAVTSVLYTLIFLNLRRSSQNSADTIPPTPTLPSHERSLRPSKSSIELHHPPKAVTPSASGHHPAFLLYPIIYTVCTLPLAVGRIATMAGGKVPIEYFCTAGALITSNGMLDVLLWGSTRRSVLFGAVDDEDALGLDTFTFMRTPAGRKYGNMVWVEGAGHKRKMAGGEGSHGEGVGDVRNGGVWSRLMRGPAGWRELGPGGGGSGSSSGRINGQRHKDGARTHSQESLQGGIAKGDSMGMAIQMDMVTTVVVEVDQDQESKAGAWTRELSAYSSRSDEKDLLPELPRI